MMVMCSPRIRSTHHQIAKIQFNTIFYLKIWLMKSKIAKRTSTAITRNNQRLIDHIMWISPSDRLHWVIRLWGFLGIGKKRTLIYHLYFYRTETIEILHGLTFSKTWLPVLLHIPGDQTLNKTYTMLKSFQIYNPLQSFFDFSKNISLQPSSIWTTPNMLRDL